MIHSTLVLVSFRVENILSNGPLSPFYWFIRVRRQINIETLQTMNDSKIKGPVDKHAHPPGVVYYLYRQSLLVSQIAGFVICILQ